MSVQRTEDVSLRTESGQAADAGLADSKRAGDRRFLIIAGQPKAGTTSLFHWLSTHPDISASTIKETRFFMDEGYPAKRASAYDGHNLEEYLMHFNEPGAEVLMEASPDYLYNRLPLSIPALLPKARVVVIVRDPVERLVSAFRYFRSRGQIPSDLDFQRYIELQAEQDISGSTPVAFRTLDQCRSSYLERFRDCFGDRLLELDFTRLKESPKDVALEVCRFIGLDEDALPHADLAAKNTTRNARWPRLVRLFDLVWIRANFLFRRNDRLRALLRPISRRVRALLFVDEGPASIEVEPETRAIIEAWGRK